MATAVALLLALGVGACGGPSDDGKTDNAAGAPAAKTDKLEPANLTLWAGFSAPRELRVHRGQHGAAGEVDFALSGDLERENYPAASGVVAFAARLAERGGLRTTLSPPFDARAIFRAARAGDELACAVVDEEARRIAQHVVPIAAVADVALIVLGRGIGANGNLLLDPIRELLAERCPHPPRVEVSSLGDAAVLTGALAIGLRTALDNVFANRSRAPGRSAAAAPER